MSFLQCVQTMSCWEALHTVWSQSCAIKFKPTTSELPVSSGKGNVRVPWVSRRRTESRTLWWRNERSWSPCWADARQAGPESERCTGSRKKKEERVIITWRTQDNSSNYNCSPLILTSDFILRSPLFTNGLIKKNTTWGGGDCHRAGPPAEINP